MRQRILSAVALLMPLAATGIFLVLSSVVLRAEDECIENCEIDEQCPIFCYWDDKKYSPGACLKSSGCTPNVQTCLESGTWSPCASSCTNQGCNKN